MKKNKLERFDKRAIAFMREYDDEFARGAFFIIFFWFGILKLFGLSPAGALVSQLLDVTFLSFIPPQSFLVFFGLFEMFIGVMAIFPKLERLTFAFMSIHMITTAMPLFLLPEVAWYQAWVPTLIGQYIMKNIALVALGMFLFARLKPMTKTHTIVGEEQ